MLDITVFMVALIAVFVISSFVTTCFVVRILMNKKTLKSYEKMYIELAEEMLEN